MNFLRPLPPLEAAELISDVRSVMRDPTVLAVMLENLGYAVIPLAGGVLALPSQVKPKVIVLAPLHDAASVSVSGLFTSAPSIAKCGAILAALRSAAASTALFFPREPMLERDGLPDCAILSLEGGVSPRIWPGCFGSADLLIRCIGRASQRDIPNMAVNALEGAVPILSALHAAASFRPAGRRNSGSRDAPLTPRLSIVAAHGGSRGSAPNLFDIVVTRRYAPNESIQSVTAEIEALVRRAAGANLRIEVSVLGNTSPVEDPSKPGWSRESHALMAGWCWPQTVFRTRAPMMSDTILFGGLENPEDHTNGVDGCISMEEVAALSVSLSTYLFSDALEKTC